MDTLRSILDGAVSMGSLVVALFFLRFWTRTRDSFFLMFAAAFAIYAGNQLMLGLVGASESGPLYYLPRLATFGLIVLAVVRKNRTGAGR